MEKLCKIRDLQRAVILFETEFEKKHGICLNEGMALCSLMDTDKLSSGELSDRLGLTCSNTSKVIKSIEKKGYVERVLGDVDKRQMYFILTPKGKELISAIHCTDIEIPALLNDII